MLKKRETPREKEGGMVFVLQNGNHPRETPGGIPDDLPVKRVNVRKLETSGKGGRITLGRLEGRT